MIKALRRRLLLFGRHRRESQLKGARRPGLWRRQLLDAYPVGDQLRRRAIDADAVDAELLHARRHRLAAARKPQRHISGAVVADEQHQFQQVSHGQGEARLVEQVGERAAAGVQVAWLDIDHLVKLQLAGVNARQQFDGDGNFESAGHRKALRAIERHATARF